MPNDEVRKSQPEATIPNAPAAKPAAPEKAGSDFPDYQMVEAEYSADQLEHLSDLEHVRERPSMYIADTTARGLHHLVYEVVDNSIDEAMAGLASEISVTINNDGSITVEDDGRGIPVEEHPELQISTLEGVMTVLKFGGKFHKGAYQTSGGLHGFYTLSMASVDLGRLPVALARKMPRYPTVPAVRLGRLAVHLEARGKGLGTHLLMDAMARSLRSEIAWAAFLVDAKEEDAHRFYGQFEMQSFQDDPLHLYVMRKTIEPVFRG